MVEIGYRFRIYPNRNQRELINRTFGCVRWVWNHFLNKRQVEYEETGTSSRAFTQMKDLPKLKKTNPWLREVDSMALQATLQHLDKAYDNFYRRCKLKKQGSYKGNVGYPRFKSKKNRRQSYKTKNVNSSSIIIVDDHHIRLPKLGVVKTRVSRPIFGQILAATITVEPCGEYYATIQCKNVPISQLPLHGEPVGIDLGLKEYCITSQNMKYSNHRYAIKAAKQLRRLKRRLSRKPMGGTNRERQRQKVAKLEQHVKNQRQDTLHKLSMQLIKEHPIICMESLTPCNMIKNHKLARHIADAAWSEFGQMLDYKAQWYGRTIIHVNRFYPSSQLCHDCGYRNPMVKDLTIRKWACPNCGILHDRDINAALNIRDEGMRIFHELEQAA